jgi:16S rRNA (guanine527-N7)-methyltransferase
MPASEADVLEAAAIEAAASSCGLAIAPTAALQLALHARLVREAASSMNLTTIVAPDAMRVRHILDSLLPLQVWPQAISTDGPAADLGAGAGYPGLPLAIVGAAPRVTLVEATRRKAQFLAQAVDACGAPAEVVWGRAEALATGVAPPMRVWARAVGPLPVLVELAFGMLAEGGVAACWKGPEALGAEAQAGEAACLALGGEPLGVRSYALPGGAGERTLFAYRRGRGDLPPGVPRAPAIIRRRPLVPR